MSISLCGYLNVDIPTIFGQTSVSHLVISYFAAFGANQFALRNSENIQNFTFVACFF